jgi:micrococcal nuclease
VEPVYRYRATAKRVIDGDTYELELDLGLRVRCVVPVRLRGLDCPEIRTQEGLAARRSAEELFKTSKSCVVETHKDTQSFARWIADVYVDGKSMADELRNRGHVKAKA